MHINLISHSVTYLIPHSSVSFSKLGLVSYQSFLIWLLYHIHPYNQKNSSECSRLPQKAVHLTKKLENNNYIHEHYNMSSVVMEVDIVCVTKLKFTTASKEQKIAALLICYSHHLLNQILLLIVRD